MADESTWREDGGSTDEDVFLLTFVLDYDDLLGPEPQTFRLEPGARLELGRAPKDSGVVGVRRGSGARVELGDRRASQRHVGLERRPGDRLGPLVLVEDLGSTNGTFLNAAPLVGRQRIVDRDLLEVGHALFVARVVPKRLAASLVDGLGVTLGPTRTLCPELAALAGDLARVGPSQEPVLVLGETGTGKEVIARTLHAASRREGELVALDCGAIPETLFESTLFGHRRGAFTGASDARTGEIVRAHRGTLFLDEVANMAPAAQAKLLRVLEEGLVTPLGASSGQAVDVRYVAATNAAVSAEAGGFRRDLLARLAGYVATLPPLRERREDLGALTKHFLAEVGATRAAVTLAAGRRLFRSKLEGNVRELRAVLRSAQLLCGGAPIDVHHLSSVALEAGAERGASPAQSVPPGQSVPTAAAPRAERGSIDAEAVTGALTAARGNVVHAAAALGVHARQLYRFIEKYSLDLERFRAGE